MSRAERRRRAELVRAVAEGFLALNNSQKADLILQIPELYFAVARLARSEETPR